MLSTSGATAESRPGSTGPAVWRLAGNANTDPNTDFLGTTDNQPLVIRTNATVGLRLVPTAGTPNVVGGSTVNTVDGGVVGATIGGGGSAAFAELNAVTGDYGTVGGGVANTASGADATVGGGGLNEASGLSATVPGGEANLAEGQYSFATGRRAKPKHDGAFVWADSSNFDYASDHADQFKVRATGGVSITTAINGSGDTTAGVHLPSGSGTWSSLSDRNAKENSAAVDGREVLAKLSTLPIQSWNYKTQDASIRHMGPTAQDFYAAFELGEDDKHLAALDTSGVALAAIQELHVQMQEKDKRVAELEEQVRALQAQNAALRTDTNTRLTALESQSQPATAGGVRAGWQVLLTLLGGLLLGAVALRENPFTTL